MGKLGVEKTTSSFEARYSPNAISHHEEMSFLSTSCCEHRDVDPLPSNTHTRIQTVIGYEEILPDYTEKKKKKNQFQAKP